MNEWMNEWMDGWMNRSYHQQRGQWPVWLPIPPWLCRPWGPDRFGVERWWPCFWNGRPMDGLVTHRRPVFIEGGLGLLERRDAIFDDVGSFVAFDAEMVLGLFLQWGKHNRLSRWVSESMRKQSESKLEPFWGWCRCSRRWAAIFARLRWFEPSNIDPNSRRSRAWTYWVKQPTDAPWSTARLSISLWCARPAAGRCLWWRPEDAALICSCLSFSPAIRNQRRLKRGRRMSKNGWGMARVSLSPQRILEDIARTLHRR